MESSAESRAHLQARLVLLSKLMFWSFVVLLAGMTLLYRAYPDIEPHHQSAIFRGSLGGIALLAAIWRGILLRRELAFAQLCAIDLAYGVLSGAAFASASCIAYDLRVSATANLTWVVLVVFLRAIVVPSTGARTFAVAAATTAPVLVGAAWLALETPQELPGPAFIASTAIICAVLVLLATISSRSIYGLRQKISEAMRLGQYTLGAKIGQGGHGAVYRAHHALLRRPTAIKLVRPERIDADTLVRFEREVQLMSQLTHPNTVAVFDYGHSPDGVFYYAMEYLDGIDLENLVTKFGPQPSDRVAAILQQICGALAEAHRRGIVHRDIKPGNIILCERGDVPDVAKVVDFGLVQLGAGDGARVLGTPAYIAPEVVTDPSSIGPAADLYALGAVGYFLLTGRPVFAGKTAVEVCVQHVTAAPLPPSQLARVSPELEAIITRCLAKQPAQRPGSAAELAALLRALPPCGDWSDAAALAWWRAFREHARPSASEPTLTITVDLQQRAA